MTLKVSSTTNLPEDILKDIFEFLGTSALRRVCKQWQACLDARFATLFKLSPIVRDWTPLTLDLKTNSDVVIRTVQAVWKILSQSNSIRQTPLMLEKALTLEAENNLILFFTAIRSSFPGGTATPTLTNDLSKDAAAIQTWMDSNQASLNTITHVTLRRSPLTALPPEIGLLTHLERFYLSHTPLASLPPDIGLLTKLQILDLSHTLLTSLPHWIGLLTKLVYLDLSHTRLDSLPHEIGKLTRLQGLHLSHTPLASLPLEIRLLISLQILDLSHTPLDSLPPGLELLTHLEILDLSHTSLTSLPPGLELLTNLQILRP